MNNQTDQAIYVGQSQSAFFETMGSPTMVSGFDDNTWYYISVDTSARAGQSPNFMHCKTLTVLWKDGVVDKIRWQIFDQNLGGLKYVAPKNLETFRLKTMLENAIDSIQPTPVQK